jgi:hypothetical protein
MKNTTASNSNLQLGELVVVSTKSKHKGETGKVHSFTPKKVRVIFSDKTIVAFYETSLRKAQTPTLQKRQSSPKSDCHQPGSNKMFTPKQNATLLKGILLELINVFLVDK